MYKIADNQIGGRYFADGELFATLEECREQLADYHGVDWSGVNEDDTPKDINTLTLAELLDYGEWEIHNEEGNYVEVTD